MDDFMESTQVILNPNTSRRAFEVPDTRSFPFEIVVAKLIIDGVEHLIYNRENKIGRSEICDVVIKSKAVSTVHAIIDAEDSNNHLICDLNSTNSTKLGSALLKPRVQYFIKNGETVTFANVTGVYEYVAKEKDCKSLPSTGNCGIETSISSDKNDGSDLIFDAPLKDEGPDSKEPVTTSVKSLVIEEDIFNMATQQNHTGHAESQESSVSSVYDLITEPPDFPISQNLPMSEPLEGLFPEQLPSQKRKEDLVFDDDVVSEKIRSVVTSEDGVSTSRCQNNDELKVEELAKFDSSKPIRHFENAPEKRALHRNEEEDKFDNDVILEVINPEAQVDDVVLVSDGTHSKEEEASVDYDGSSTPQPVTQVEAVPENKDPQKSEEMEPRVKPVRTFTIIDDPAVKNLPNKKRFAKNRAKVFADSNSDHASFSAVSVGTEVKAREPVEEVGGGSFDEEAPTQLVWKEKSANQDFKSSEQDVPTEDIYSAATQAASWFKTRSDGPFSVKECTVLPKKRQIDLEEAETQIAVQKSGAEKEIQLQSPSFSFEDQNSLEGPTQKPAELIDERKESSDSNLLLNLSEVPTQLINTSRQATSAWCNSQLPLRLAFSESRDGDDASNEEKCEDLQTTRLSELPTQAVKRIEEHLEEKAEGAFNESEDEDEIIPCSQPVAKEKPQTSESRRSPSSSPVLRSRIKRAPPLPATQNADVDDDDDDDDDELCSPVLRTTPKKLVPLQDSQQEPDESGGFKAIIDESEAIEETVIAGVPSSQEVIVRCVSAEEVQECAISQTIAETKCQETPTRSTQRIDNFKETAVQESQKEETEGIDKNKLTEDSSAILLTIPTTPSTNSTPTKSAIRRNSPTPVEAVVLPATPKLPETELKGTSNSLLEFAEANSSIFNSNKDKPRVKKYFNRNKMGNSSSFLIKEPAATSTPVRFVSFEDSPSGKVYEVPDKHTEDASKSIVTLFSDTVIPPPLTLKPNGRKSSRLSKTLPKKAARSSTSSGDETTSVTVSSSKRPSNEGTGNDVLSATETRLSSGNKSQRKGRSGDKGGGQSSGSPSKSDPRNPSSVESETLDTDERRKSRRKMVRTSETPSKPDLTPSKKNRSPVAHSPDKRGTRRKVVANPTVSPKSSAPRLGTGKTSTPPKTDASPRKVPSRQSLPKLEKEENLFTSLDSAEDSDFKAPSRSVVDLSSDNSSQESDVVQKRTRKPPNRIMDDLFQPIPFVPSSRINPKSPTKMVKSKEPEEILPVRRSIAKSSDSQPQEEVENDVDKRRRPLKRHSGNKPCPDSSKRECSRSPEGCSSTPLKRTRKALNIEPKEKRRVIKGSQTQSTQGSQNTQEQNEGVEVQLKIRGRRRKYEQTEDTQPCEASQNSHDEPVLCEPRGRRGKAQKTDDPRDAQTTVEETSKRNRARARNLLQNQDVQSTRTAGQLKESKSCDARHDAASLIQSQSTQDSQNSPSGVKRSSRVRKKKLPFDEISSEKEKEVLAKKQRERTTRKRVSRDVSIEYDLLPKSRNKGVDETSFTIAAVRRAARSTGISSTSSSLRSSILSSSTAKTRLHKKGEHVMFTGYSNRSMENLVKKLGGEMVNCPYSCSVLVTDHVRRTVKFLCAVSRGVPIVSVKWLDSCRASNSFTDPDDWILEDDDAEKKFAFNLRTSLNLARNAKFLDGWKVYVTSSVKPPPSEMKMIIECSGGKCLCRAPAASASKTFVVSCLEDRGQWAKLAKNSKSPPIVSVEGILSGVLQQKLTLERHLLS